jgi:serine/threonine protein kinase
MYQSTITTICDRYTDEAILYVLPISPEPSYEDEVKDSTVIPLEQEGAKKIGEGVYGEVRISPLNCSEVVKTFKRSNNNMPDFGVKATVLHESGVYGRFSKESGLMIGSIVPTRDQECYEIRMPRAAGNLTELSYKMKYINRVKTLPILTYQLLVALYHLHSQGLMHRDIKPDNILYTEATLRVYLADFGLSRVNNRGEKSNLAFSNLICHAGEQANYSEKLDIAMLAATMLAFLDKDYHNIRHLCDRMNKYHDHVITKGRFPLQELYAKTVKTIKRMACRNPENRPTAKQAIIEIYGESALVDVVSLQPPKDCPNAIAPERHFLLRYIISGIRRVAERLCVSRDTQTVEYYTVQTFDATFNHLYWNREFWATEHCVIAMITMCYKNFFPHSILVSEIYKIVVSSKTPPVCLEDVLRSIGSCEKEIFRTLGYKFPRRVDKEMCENFTFIL